MHFMGAVGRLAFVAFLLSLLIGLAASFGTHVHLWGERTGLLDIFPWCIYFGIVAFVCGLIWALSALLLDASRGAGYGVIGLIGSIVLLTVPVYDLCMAEIAHAYPPIHDISTDVEYAPQFVALKQLRPRGSTPSDYDGPKLVDIGGKSYATSSLQKLYYSDLRPIEVLIPPARLFDRALTAANVMGWNIVSSVRLPDGGRIEATDTTFFFGFTDDIVIRVKPSGMGSRLDIRSKSRADLPDFGRNAARIRAYAKTLANT